ncbi:ogr/Delta-like zinc finger family protein [Neisseria dentiae]|uniref:ogr/Delta-like zinc finger family protein n=1 Tax=Neisseria dentiae TaxID=194197 RepID=UPI0035A05A89
MSKRSISRAESCHGNMRVQIICPCCGGRCKVAGSRQVTSMLRNSYVQCLNVACGWSGVAATEVIRTISPPSPLYRNAPPPLDAAGVEELENNMQPQLIDS